MNTDEMNNKVEKEAGGRAKLNRSNLLGVLTMCVLTFATGFICARIEILNIRAGGMLPRTLPEEGNPKWRSPLESERFWRFMRRQEQPSLADPEMAIGKVWPLPYADRKLLSGVLERERNSFSPDEVAELRIILKGDEEPQDGYYLFRRLISLIPLSAEEKAQMDRYIASAKADNRLHGAVETIGLLQYLLAPIAWIVAGVVILHPLPWRYRSLAIFCLLIASASIVLMTHRAYLPSLGW